MTFNIKTKETRFNQKLKKSRKSKQSDFFLSTTKSKILVFVKYRSSNEKESLLKLKQHDVSIKFYFPLPRLFIYCNSFSPIIIIIQF